MLVTRVTCHVLSAYKPLLSVINHHQPLVLLLLVPYYQPVTIGSINQLSSARWLGGTPAEVRILTGTWRS